MVSEHFSINHETHSILSQFPVLKELSERNEYGLEEAKNDDETLLETLKSHKYSDDEIKIILRKMHAEVDRLYKE